MRQILIGCCLFASCLSIPGSCQPSGNQDWFNNSSKENEKQLDDKKREDSKAKEQFGKTKDGFDQLKEEMRQLHEKVNKEREELKKLDKQRAEENRRRMEEERKTFEKREQEFKKNWETKRKQSKEFFEKREKEFDQLRERLKEDLQRQSQQQEQEEIEQIKEIIISQLGLKQPSNYEIASSNFQEQCFKCSSEQLFQDPQVLVFMSFSIPDDTWIGLSPELEKVGGTFVLRGLPDQSFQALASRILKLKEQGVNVPIQLDPKSFLKFEITQVPSMVVVEEQNFDKVSGLISLKFALEKMAERGETQIAKTLYYSLKGRV
jgi:conjugal transfer pilus assembly protein TrbC